MHPFKHFLFYNLIMMWADIFLGIWQFGLESFTCFQDLVGVYFPLYLLETTSLLVPLELFLGFLEQCSQNYLQTGLFILTRLAMLANCYCILLNFVTKNSILVMVRVSKFFPYHLVFATIYVDSVSLANSPSLISSIGSGADHTPGHHCHQPWPWNSATCR